MLSSHAANVSKRLNITQLTPHMVAWNAIRTSEGKDLDNYAQPDGRPSEHRWRPLFNAAKFG